MHIFFHWCLPLSTRRLAGGFAKQPRRLFCLPIMISLFIRLHLRLRRNAHEMLKVGGMNAMMWCRRMVWRPRLRGPMVGGAGRMSRRRSARQRNNPLGMCGWCGRGDHLVDAAVVAAQLGMPGLWRKTSAVRIMGWLGSSGRRGRCVLLLLLRWRPLMRIDRVCHGE